MGKFDNKVAFITGASGGNGEGIARILAKNGATVILTDIQEIVFETAEDIRSLGFIASAYKLDVTKSVDVTNVTKKVYEEFGRIDILINNAGIAKLVPFLEMSDELRDKIMDINFNGVWNCTKSILPIMVKQNYGKIVNISSVTGSMVVDFGQVAYSASKSAVCGLTKGLALEVAKKGITVNAVLPGYVDTPMVREVAKDVSPTDPLAVIEALARNIPMGRLGTPSEVGDLVAFLSSDESRYITGSLFVFDGGSTLPEVSCVLTQN